MASIRKRGNKWQAQVRRDSARPVSRSFHLRADAERWARQVEAAIERGDRSALDQKRAKFVSCLLSKYVSEVTPSKRGASEETYRINAMLRDRIAEIPLSRLRSQAIADYRDRRLTSVSAPSVRRELVILRHVFEVSRREWNSGPRHNPVAEIRIPNHAKSREMRLTQAEYADLLRGTAEAKAWWLKPIIQIAVETAMRRGEILNARWIDLNLKHRTLRIPITKNGEAR
ncbi:MAG: tyrosine-type recombinase/integrase, partial [Parvibaculales bacterium]